MPILAAFAVPHPPIIIPEVGRGEEAKIKKTADAFDEVMRRAAELRPDTVVVTSPHAALYWDYFHISPGDGASGDLGGFRAPGARVDAVYDAELAARIAELASRRGVSAGGRGERDARLDHGTLIPLLFLTKYYKDFKLVRVGLSGQSPEAHFALGKCIAEAAEGLSRRVVLIASGDLSHKLRRDGPYGFAAAGPEFDALVTGALGAGDLKALLGVSPELCEAAAECGLRSFQIMAGALDGLDFKSRLLSYEGTFGVGYCVASFLPEGEQKAPGEEPYVALARLSLESYVRTGRRAALPEGLPRELLESRAGVFVSLKKHGELRGCIGTIAPTTASVAEEIMQNAVSSAVRDPRFPPVREEELAALDISVDVLGEPRDVASPDELDVMRYGVIVRSGARRGLLLPMLEGVDSVRQQIDIACRKAGIYPGERVTLQAFEVVRHT